jgi:hypothetical protein
MIFARVEDALQNGGDFLTKPVPRGICPFFVQATLHSVRSLGITTPSEPGPAMASF